MKQGNQADLTHNLKAQPPADSNNELSVVQSENIPKKYPVCTNEDDSSTMQQAR